MRWFLFLWRLGREVWQITCCYLTNHCFLLFTERRCLSLDLLSRQYSVYKCVCIMLMDALPCFLHLLHSPVDTSERQRCCCHTSIKPHTRSVFLLIRITQHVVADICYFVLGCHADAQVVDQFSVPLTPCIYVKNQSVKATCSSLLVSWQQHSMELKGKTQ